MTNEDILISVKSMFGENIVENAYAIDLEDVNNTETIMTEESIETQASIIVEFKNGKKVKIAGIYGWSWISPYKDNE
jgi:hypothetical protein